MAIKLTLTPKHAGKYSDEDLQAHETVAAIFSKGTGDSCKYLVLDHVKHNMLAPCVGKVKSDQTVTEGLLTEVEEELGVKLTQYKELLNYSKTYDFGGVKVAIKTHVFKAISHTGTISNKEPKKHKSLTWMTRSEIEKSKRKIADAFLAYFKWLDDTNTPTTVKPAVTVGSGK